MSGKNIKPEVVSYDFSDAVPIPRDVGVADGESLEQVINNVKGVNYYIDFMAFGQKTMLNDRDVTKPGLRRFKGTGLTCSNGAEMHVYEDSTTQGDLLGKRIKRALMESGLPLPAGVAPGILEDARDAFNPVPIFAAAMGSGYPECKQISMPVGDLYGRTGPDQDDTGPTTWVEGTIQQTSSGPRQTKWVQNTDKKGNAVWLDEAAYSNTPKTQNFDGSQKKQITEKFTPNIAGVILQQSGIVLRKSDVLVVGLIVALGAIFITFKH